MRLATVGVDLASEPDQIVIAVWNREQGGSLVLEHTFSFTGRDRQLVEQAVRQLRQVYPLGRRVFRASAPFAPRRA